jgi:hypothetical protein
VIRPGDAEGRKGPTPKKKFMRGLAVTLPGIVEKVIPPNQPPWQGKAPIAIEGVRITF